MGPSTARRLEEARGLSPSASPGPAVEFGWSVDIKYGTQDAIDQTKFAEVVAKAFQIPEVDVSQAALMRRLAETRRLQNSRFTYKVVLLEMNANQVVAVKEHGNDGALLSRILGSTVNVLAAPAVEVKAKVTLSVSAASKGKLGDLNKMKDNVAAVQELFASTLKKIGERMGYTLSPPVIRVWPFLELKKGGVQIHLFVDSQCEQRLTSYRGESLAGCFKEMGTGESPLSLQCEGTDQLTFK
jgi:hypothetical protein